MKVSTDLHTVGLLLLINRLLTNHRLLGRDTIVPFAALKLPGVEKNYEALVQDLLKQGLVVGTTDVFELTTSGKEAVTETAGAYSLTELFYNEYYRAVSKSPAHAEFCERAYGKNLCQHGMTTMEQIHSLLQELSVGPGFSLLDFGCGDGRITEYISDITGAYVTGVDIAGDAIALAAARTQSKQDRMHFYCANIEKDPGDFPRGPFDVIIALDSIFFTADLFLATRNLLQKLAPGGRLAAFFLAGPGVAPDQTPLGKVLVELHRDFTVFDLSAASSLHWQTKKAALLELAPRFEAEGNLFLYKNRMAECESDIGACQRYLYITS